MANRWLILSATAVAITVAVWARAQGSDTPAPDRVEVAPPAAVKLPTFVELGSDRCRSCKAMVPVLARLRREGQGRLAVQFFDVWIDEAAGKRFGIKSIPTQVFLDPDGAELFRHQGYFAFEAVVERWRALGYEVLDKAAKAAPSAPAGPDAR